MPTHKFACPEGVLHIRISNVHQPLTMELLHEEFHRHGAWYVLCAFERVVGGMYGVEAYVQFRSRWRAARARDAMDGCTLYKGCCSLAVEVVPPVYSSITTPDELPPPYFYDDTPYSEWAAADSASTSPDIPMSATTPVASASCDVIEDSIMPEARHIYDILVGGAISTTSMTVASVCAATSTCVSPELFLDSTPTSVLVEAATHESDHDSAMSSRTTSSTEGLGGNIGVPSGVCPANCATPSCLLPVAPSTVVTAVQRHSMMPSASEEFDVIPEAVITKSALCADTTFTAESLAESSTTDLAFDYGASTESNHTETDTAQSIINVESDLAIVIVPRNMTLTAVSVVAGQLNTGLLTIVTIQNGHNASLEPDSRIFSKVFMGRYNVFAVMFRPLILVVTCDEALLWLIFQSATVNTNLLLPWDPGQPWYGGDSKLGTVEHGLLVLLSTAGGVAYFHGDSIHELFTCSFVSEMIKKWMAEFVELQPRSSQDTSSLVTQVYHQPPPAEPPVKLNCIPADKREKILWSIQIVYFFYNCSWLEHTTNLFEFKVRQVLALHPSTNGTKTNVLCTGCYYFLSVGSNQFAQPFSGSKLQYYTEFESTTQTDQHKYIIGDYVKSISVPSFQFGTTGNASIYGSHHFQWYIAWSHTLACDAVSTIHLARSILRLMTTEALASTRGMHLLIGGAAVHYSAIFQLEIAWALELECFDWSFQSRQPICLDVVIEVLDITFGGLNLYCSCGSLCKNDLTEPSGDEPNSREWAGFYLQRRQKLWDISIDLDAANTTKSPGITGQYLQLPWDPGDRFSSTWRPGNPARVTDGSVNSGIYTSHVPWDPGGLEEYRLGGKPKFKKGGLSATLLQCTWAGQWTATAGPRPAQRIQRKLLQIGQEVSIDKWARNGTALAWLGPREDMAGLPPLISSSL